MGSSDAYNRFASAKPCHPPIIFLSRCYSQICLLPIGPCSPELSFRKTLRLVAYQMLATGTETASDRSVPRHAWFIFCAMLSWCRWIFSYFGIPGRCQPNYAASSPGKASRTASKRSVSTHCEPTSQLLRDEALQSRLIHAQHQIGTGAVVELADGHIDARIKAIPKTTSLTPTSAIVEAAKPLETPQTPNTANSAQITCPATKTAAPPIRHAARRSTQRFFPSS